MGGGGGGELLFGSRALPGVVAHFSGNFLHRTPYKLHVFHLPLPLPLPITSMPLRTSLPRLRPRPALRLYSTRPPPPPTPPPASRILLGCATTGFLVGLAIQLTNTYKSVCIIYTILSYIYYRILAHTP